MSSPMQTTRSQRKEAAIFQASVSTWPCLTDAGYQDLFACMGPDLVQSVRVGNHEGVDGCCGAAAKAVEDEMRCTQCDASPLAASPLADDWKQHVAEIFSRGPCTFFVLSPRGCFHYHEDGRPLVVCNGGTVRRGEQMWLTEQSCRLIVAVCLDDLEDDKEYKKDILGDLLSIIDRGEVGYWCYGTHSYIEVLCDIIA